MEVAGVEPRQRQGHEGRQRHHLEDHQVEVDRGALPGADQQHAGDRQGDEDGRQVDQPGGLPPGPGGQRLGQAPAVIDQESLGVAGPADGHRRADHGVFEDQAPADDPADQLAHAGVGVGVGRARLGHHGGHLGVAEGGERTDPAGDREGQDHRRPRLARADADQGVDAGADDRADAQRHEVRPAQCLFQVMAALGAGLRLDWLPACHKAHEPSPERGVTMARVARPRQGLADAPVKRDESDPHVLGEHDNFEINRLWIQRPEQC